MRHLVDHRKLGRPTDQRLAILRSLVKALLEHGKVETTLILKNWTADRKLTVRIELEAPAGKPEVNGRFEVEPLL